MKVKSILLMVLMFVSLGCFAAPSIQVTLLGTASATTISSQRYGMATVVRVNGKALLFDAGRGALIRLHEAGVDLRDISAIFITHLHSDHLTGLPDIYATAPIRGRNVPFDLYGPPDITRVADGLKLMFAPNNAIREKDNEINAWASNIIVHPITKEGVVYDQGGVKVTAFLVDHGQNVKPAFGYRVDYQGRSVVISGDTRYTANLVKHSQNVDLLIHCVVAARPEMIAAVPDTMNHLYGYLASPDDVARVLNETKPHLGVLSHITLFAGGGIAPETDDMLHQSIASKYKGNFLVGHDLETYDIFADGHVELDKQAANTHGDDAVSVSLTGSH